MIYSIGLQMYTLVACLRVKTATKLTDFSDILFAQLIKVYLIEDWQWGLGLK